MKKIFLLGTITLTFPIFSTGLGIEDSETSLNDSGFNNINCCNPPPSCKKPCDPQICPIILTPEGLNCRPPIYLSLEGLYWRPALGSADWAVCTDLSGSSTPKTLPSSVYQSRFKYNLGLRVTAGLSLSHDNWDIQASYLWYRNKTSSHITIDSGGPKYLYSLYDYPWRGYDFKENMKFNLNLLEFKLGRKYFISNSILSHPYIGIKGVDFSFKIDDYYISEEKDQGDDYHFSYKMPFIGLGPLMGMEHSFLVASSSQYNCSLFADFNISLLSGSNKNYSHLFYKDDKTPRGAEELPINYKMPRVMFEGKIGFKFENPINDRMNFSVKLGYEIQYWFRYNQRRAMKFEPGTIENRNTYHLVSDDLALDGLNLEIGVNF